MHATRAALDIEQLKGEFSHIAQLDQVDVLDLLAAESDQGLTELGVALESAYVETHGTLRDAEVNWSHGLWRAAAMVFKHADIRHSPGSSDQRPKLEVLLKSSGKRLRLALLPSDSGFALFRRPVFAPEPAVAHLSA